MVRSKWAIVCLCIILLSSFYIGYEQHTNANQSQIIATGTVQVNSLNVRSTPSTTGTRVGSLSRGATVSIYERNVNGNWLKIQMNNQWAYVHGDYVRVTPVSNSSNNSSSNSGTVVATGTVNVNSLNVRQSPSTTAARVASLARGATVQIYETGISGNWLKIRVNNQWAYVHGDYITLTRNNNSSSNNSSNTSNNNTGSIIATGTVNVNSLNVRQTASTTGTRVGSLARGATVSIYERNINGNWLKIRANNQWAFIHGDFVTISSSSNNQNSNNSTSNNNNNSSSNTIVATGTVNVNSLNVRQTASTSGTRVGSLARGASVSIYEQNVNGNWLKIKMNNQWAYVHGEYVTVTVSNNNQGTNSDTSNNNNNNTNNNSDTVVATGTVNVNLLNVRQTASTSGTRVGTLNQGTTVSIYERNVNGNWLKIKMNNQWAYVHGDFVTINNTNSNSSGSSNTNNNTSNSNSVVATGTVNVTTLNVRQTPASSGNRVGILARGSSVSIYETNVNGNWLKIKHNNQWAYIHGDFVTVTVSNNSQNSSGSANSGTVPTNALAGRTIVIDPGHGGSDPGAVGNGLREKDITLRVSLELQKKLEAAGAKVVMTRTTDSFVSVNKRFEIANASNGHSFVSIHTNSLSNSQAHGTETFWNRSHQHADSQKLAQVAQKHLVQQLHTRDRGVKEGSFAVVRYTRIPSILVELGFITNPNDANMMKQDRFYEDASEALLRALIEFHK